MGILNNSLTLNSNHWLFMVLQKAKHFRNKEQHLRLGHESFNEAETKMSRKYSTYFKFSDTLARFNEAETKMSRKYPSLLDRTCSRLCFNEAEAKKPRKLQVAYPFCARTILASMGPRQKSLGNNAIRRHDIVHGGASMRPRQKSLGNLVPHAQRQTKVMCFNGAEAKKPRKYSGVHKFMQY